MNPTPTTHRHIADQLRRQALCSGQAIHHMLAMGHTDPDSYRAIGRLAATYAARALQFEPHAGAEWRQSHVDSARMWGSAAKAETRQGNSGYALDYAKKAAHSARLALSA